MGFFSKNKKGSKKNKKQKAAFSDDSVSLLRPQDEARENPPMVPEPPIRTFNTLKQQLMDDNNSMVEVDPPTKGNTKGNQPPPAREAAFHGPPRFDWMDNESNAAIKIQSVQRRNVVMNDLEARGLSTAAIRNRKRRRLAAKEAHPYMTSQSQDAPSIFACCAVGLAFGDATEDGDDAYRLLEKRKYEDRQQQQAVHEEALRRQYMTKHGINPGKIVEALEVVD